MDEEAIKAIKVALTKITPGVWKWSSRECNDYNWLTGDNSECVIDPQIFCEEYGVIEISDEDAFFIANSPTWIRLLLEENSRLNGMINYKL